LVNSLQLGHATEAAFGRAFKCIRGVGPGEVRRVAGRRREAGDTPRDGCSRCGLSGYTTAFAFAALALGIFLVAAAFAFAALALGIFLVAAALAFAAFPFPDRGHVTVLQIYDAEQRAGRLGIGGLAETEGGHQGGAEDGGRFHDWLFHAYYSW
jgi:hypothetical protein